MSVIDKLVHSYMSVIDKYMQLNTICDLLKIIYLKLMKFYLSPDKFNALFFLKANFNYVVLSDFI